MSSSSWGTALRTLTCASLVASLGACQVAETQEGELKFVEETVAFSKKTKSLGNNCYHERIIQPPGHSRSHHGNGNSSKHEDKDKSEDKGNSANNGNKGKSGKAKKFDRDVPLYLLEGPFAPYLDFDTLRVKLNEQDIDYSVSLETGELIFSNPGKSRAVIDLTYCLVQSPPVDGGGDDNDGGQDSGGGDTSGGGDDTGGGDTGSGDGDTNGGDDGSTVGGGDTGGTDGGTNGGSDGGTNGGTDDGSNGGDDGGGIIVINECTALTCGDVGI